MKEPHFFQQIRENAVFAGDHPGMLIFRHTNGHEIMSKPESRRKFLGAAATTVAVLGTPAILTARRTGPTRRDETVIGKDDYKFKVNHQWAQLPDKYHWPDQWQDGVFVHPHDACFDPEGNVFVAEWVQTGRVTKLTRLV